ncbi:MAG TPA: undecaprenyl-diphosphate phosphatase, partial [Firmicutes bacterium]|nr:undecaprenyl-diphosphate phosphatase [Bacillota bacterium]
AMPVILGPTILTIGDLIVATGVNDGSASLLPLTVGTLAALIAGVFAIRVLLQFVQRGRLSWFAYYCWAVGGLGLVFF